MAKAKITQLKYIPPIFDTVKRESFCFSQLWIIFDPRAFPEVSGQAESHYFSKTTRYCCDDPRLDFITLKNHSITVLSMLLARFSFHKTHSNRPRHLPLGRVHYLCIAKNAIVYYPIILVEESSYKPPSK